jgi:hypothetical protein
VSLTQKPEPVQPDSGYAVKMTDGNTAEAWWPVKELL